MSGVFLEILNGSIAASWLVLAILLARLALKQAPRWLVCGLWLLVAARLLLPGTIESPVSLVPSTQTIPPQSMYDAAPAIDSGVEIVDTIINPVYTESFRTDGLSSVNPLQVWTAVSANLWLLGMLVMLLWAAVSWLRIRNRVREHIHLHENVWLCDRIDSPFIFGMFAPKIYLPSGLPEDTRSHVIAHEQAHLRRRDHWWKPLGFALLTVHWFNPLMWIAYVLLCRDIEMACDERVVRDLGLDEKKAYSAALLRCSVSPRMIAACPLAFGEVGVKQRIKSVLHYKKPAFWVILIVLLLIVVLGVCFLTDPLSRDPVIRWDGVYYDLSGNAVAQLDPQFVSEGDLVSVLHDDTLLPDMDAQAVNLDWEYAGCEVYRNPTDPQKRMLYLQQPGGTGYLPFSLRTPNALLRELLKEAPKVMVNVDTDNTFTTEELLGDRDIYMKMILHNLENIEFFPGELSFSGNVSLHIYPEDNYGNAIRLDRARDNTWELYIVNEEYGPSSWLFTCEELNEALLRYEARAEYGNAFFSDPVYDDPNRNVHIAYKNYYDNGLQMTAGIPYAVVEWESEELKSGLGEEFVGFRCRPVGKSGWLNVAFYPSTEHALPMNPRKEAISNPSGTRYCSADGRPELYELDTVRGQLLAQAEDTADWTEEDWSIAEFILSTITVHNSDGSNLMGQSAPSADEPEGHYAARFEFDNLSPGMTMTLAEDLTITGGNVPWQITWVRPIFELTVALRDSAGREYPVIVTEGTGYGIFGDLPDGLYDLLIHSPRSNQELSEDADVTGTISLDLEEETPELGVSLHVENVSPAGLTLICTQDGTPLTHLMTGTPYYIERWEDGYWAEVPFPEGTAWTMVGVGVPIGDSISWRYDWTQFWGELPPGQYRISKSFTGTLPNPGVMGYIPKDVDETCYAEFTIE